MIGVDRNAVYRDSTVIFSIFQGACRKAENTADVFFDGYAVVPFKNTKFFFDGTSPHKHKKSAPESALEKISR